MIAVTRDRVNVDVVIPVYNGQRFIESALQSVFNQTFPPNRIIVVNDGSTDGTEEIVLRLQRKSSIEIVYHSKANGGLSSARNAGISLSKAEYIAFLDADDEWFPFKLESQLALFLRSSFQRLGLVYCRYQIIGVEGTAIDYHVALPRADVRGRVFNLLMNGNYVTSSASGVLVKRECFDRVGVFDAELDAAEDWDMWLRIAEEYEFDFVSDRDLVKIRMHNSNMQKDAVLMFKNILKFYNKWAFSTDRRGQERVVPRSWAHHLSSQIAKLLPGINGAMICDSLLSTSASRRIFSFSFGSVRMYVLFHICFLFCRAIFSNLKLALRRIHSLFQLARYEQSEG
jgi:glycosyltransferase involved in cell wall biosynthesis